MSTLKEEKMHEAYNVSNILQLTVQIECIAAYDETLLLGTRQGHLYMYYIIPKDDKPEVSLMRLNKSFSKKAIQQIEVIPEYQLLISLSDNLISVHDLNAATFPVIHQIANTKGATLFTVHTKKETSLTGVATVLVRMCVAVKRKLQLYYLKKNEFMSMGNDINLKEIPKALAWCQETICVGYRGEYCLYDLEGKQTELFPTGSGRSSDPCIVKTSETTFALGRENKTVLVNHKGATEKSKALQWSDVPTALIWDEPYVMGILPDSIDVQNLDPPGLIQTLSNLSKVRIMTRCHQGLLYAASIGNVWYISAVEVATQRKVLLDNKQFQLAIQLTMTSDESEDEKNNTIHHIHTLLAYDLFRRKEFSASMKEFLSLKTDPYDVIRLFPDLLPQSSNQEVQDNPENLTDKEREDGILALIEFLMEIRRNTQPEAKGSLNASGNLNERAASTKSTQQLLQIIDTTLLKCYLQTNDALVAPLLRLNHCHLAEAERTLKRHGKHNELIILYQTKGQHRRALELLQADGSLERTVSYLQKLGSEHVGLILEFADWVLKKSPEEGLKIFTEDLTEVETLPRPRVLDYLIRSHASLVIPYSEHVVHTWEDVSSLFHNILVHFYREKALSDDTSGGHIRKKLYDFLQKSQYYTPDIVLVGFPTNSLLEERAVILGRLGRHEQALSIYIRALGDIEMAIAYCDTMYDPRVNNTRDVYVFLLQIILEPNKIALSLPDVTLSPKTAEPNLEKALEILEKYATRMNPYKALSVLPPNVPMSRINKFLQVALHEKVRERRRVQLLKGLLYAENLQCQEMRLQLLSKSFLINDLNVCPVCKKRFGNQSALVRYPNGDVVHYSCQEKKL